MFIDLHVKYSLFLSDCNKTLNFLDEFSKNTEILIFVKIRPVGAEMSLADGRTDGQKDRQTDIMKLIVAFRNFANAYKKIFSHCTEY